MTDTVATRDEDHCRRTKLRHEERIVIGATDHSLGSHTELTANLLDALHEPRLTERGRVSVDDFDFPADAAPAGDFVDGFADTFESFVACGQVRVAQIDFEQSAMRDAVDGAGLDAEDAGRAHGID